jgi:hypothetical protein
MYLGSRRKDRLCLAFLFVLGALLCQRIVRGQAGLGPDAVFDRDAVYGSAPLPVRPYDDWTPIVIEVPRDRRIAERARAGRFDLWNPLQGTGVPMAPDQGGLFSPLRLIHLLWPSVGGYALYHCVRLWIAAAGAFFFARSRGISRQGSTLAGVAFGFGGGMVAQLPFVSAGPVCFLPWVLFAQEALLRRPSGWARVAVGLALGAMLTAGHPTLAATVMIAAALHGLVGVVRRRERWLRLVDLGAGWAFGLAFAAPFLLPFAELMANGYSYKSTGIGLYNHAEWRAITRGCIGPGLVAPSLIDAVRDGVSQRTYPYILHFVMGTAAWVLGCFGVVRRRVAVDLYLIIAVGALLSVEVWGLEGVSRLPLLGAILPRYYWQLVTLPVACAAGAGVDAIASASRRRTPGELVRLGLGVLLFYGLVKGALAAGRLEGSHVLKDWVKLAVALPAARSRVLGYHLVVLAALAIVAASARLGRHRATGLLLLVSADLVFLLRPHLGDRPSVALRRPLSPAVRRFSAAAASTHARMTGPTHQFAMAPLSSLSGIADIRMTSPLVPERYDAFLHAAGAGDAFTLFMLPTMLSPWADLAAVRFLVTDEHERPSLMLDPTVREWQELPLSMVLENPSAFERARLFFGAVTAKGQEDATTQLRALRQGGDHIEETSLRDTLVLEPAGTIEPQPLAGKGSVAVRWVLDDSDEVVLETDGAQAGYLMLADTYYPGWKATVDGGAAPIFPADVGFRAVPVPAGRHTVRFVYRPASLWSGVLVLAAAAVVAWVTARRSAKAGRGGSVPQPRWAAEPRRGFG